MYEELTDRQAEAAELLESALSGHRGDREKLIEGISTSDLPVQLGPALTMKALNNYESTPHVAGLIATPETLDDFREQPYRNFTFDDKDVEQSNDGKAFYSGGLPAVAEYDGYPVLRFSASGETLKLRKGGVQIRFSWESIVNDRDFGVLDKVPAEFGRRSAYQEDIEVASQMVKPAGLNADNFSAGSQNVLAANADLATPINAPLTADAVQAAFQQIAKQTYNGNAVVPASGYNLVCSPTLAPKARAILAVTEVQTTEVVGGKTIVTKSGNPLAGKFDVVELAQLAQISPTVSDTCWFLIPKPNTTPNPSIVLSKLRGHEQPEIWIKSTDAFLPGGGAVPARMGHFDDDSFQTRVRHTATGGFLLPQGTMASTGKGV